MYDAIEELYRNYHYELIEDTSAHSLRPAKSVVKDAETCVDKFKKYYISQNVDNIIEDTVPIIVGKIDLEDNSIKQNLRTMQELHFLREEIDEVGKKKYRFTEVFKDFVNSGETSGCYILDQLYKINSIDDMEMYYNYILCVLREGYLYGQIIKFPDSEPKFVKAIPDKAKRDAYRQRVFKVYGFQGRTKNGIAPDEYTPNISYYCQGEYTNLGLVERGNKIDGLDTWVLTTGAKHLLKTINDNLSKNKKLRLHMNIVPSKYQGDINPLIIYGAPGTGKTTYMQDKIYSCYEKDNRFFLTFHQSYSYEEFVEGLKPILNKESENVKYHIEKGIFYDACERAAIMAGYENLKVCIEDTNENRKIRFDKALREKKTVLLCIDEINRANVSSVFGDLISLVETSKRLGAGEFEMTAILPYSKEEFGVPANLFVVGTMNTADRSILLLDSALRRRFRFEELTPDYNSRIYKNSDATEILKRINANIRCLLNKDSQIGHSYLMNAATHKDILSVLFNKIIPLLEEYFYDDIQKVRFILNENDKITYPFYIKDVVAEEAYKNYIDQNNLVDEEREFYILNPEIEELLNLNEDNDNSEDINQKCYNYLLHLLGKSEIENKIVNNEQKE